MMYDLYEWAVLETVRKRNYVVGDVIMCPTERIADNIMKKPTSFLRVKIRSRELRRR